MVSAYIITAIGLELVRMTFGLFGPLNLLEINENADAALVATRVQLTLISAYCLTGVGILVARRLRDGRQLRWSLALLADAFGLALVMIAALLMSAAWGGPAVQQIRWATFAALSLAPVAFLVALLHSRLARSSVGDLFVELQADPAPADLRAALARALSDPPSHLPTGSRTTAATRITTAASSSCPTRTAARPPRASTRGEFMWRCSCTTRRWRTSPSC